MELLDADGLGGESGRALVSHEAGSVFRPASRALV